MTEEVGVGILDTIKRRKDALNLSEKAFSYSTGNLSFEELTQVIETFEVNDPVDSHEVNYVTDDLETLLTENVSTSGLRFRLNCLNKSLGSLRKGDFGFIFARPETGKTTFLASEISYMLKQLDKDSGPILWFNNEEQGSKVMLRIYQAYFGVSLETLFSNPQKYKQEYEAASKGKFRLVDNASASKWDIERIVKLENPSLIIYDQIDKIKGFTSDREDLRLGAIYQWARELAKEYAPSIGVCQADGSAEGQKWLTMDNVANAKTSKQAEADWILGIGKIHEEGAQYIRYLNISKNKLIGDTDSIPHLRHGRFEVLIQPEEARYKDIVVYD